MERIGRWLSRGKAAQPVPAAEVEAP